MQVVNVHLCRNGRASLFSMPLFNNRLITAGVVAELGLILLIDYTAIGNRLFGTAPIPLSVWLVMLPFAGGMLVLEELRKGVVRGRASIPAASRQGLRGIFRTPPKISSRVH
jgi:hypothetical protein